MSYVDSQAPSNSRFTGLVVVVVFHAALGYALVNGLARKIVEVVTQPLETKIIEEVKQLPPDKPPPPPPPKLAAPPPPYIPPPEIQVQVPQSAATQSITAVTTAKPTGPVAAPGQRFAPPAPVTRSVRTAPVVDARACDKPEYPAAALRASETGIVQLAFLIEVDGTAVESKIDRSSGSRRLDEAARKALSLCKFKPATVDGKPERAWAKIEYEWKLD